MAKTIRLTLVCFVVVSAAMAQRFTSKFIGSNTNSATVGFPTNWPVETVAVGASTATPSGWNTNWTAAEMNAHMAALQTAVNSRNATNAVFTGWQNTSNEVAAAVALAKGLATETNALGRFLAAQATVNQEIFTRLRLGTFTNMTKIQYLNAVVARIEQDK